MLLRSIDIRWNCPNCPTQLVTHSVDPVPFHPCRGLSGLTAPLVQEGSDARVRAVVREDYVGTEEGVTHDSEGRPVMAIVTERPDGSNDLVVLAPTATATAEAGQ